MLETINDLIDISRIEAGLVETVFEKENINQVLEDHLEFFLPEANSKRIKLKLAEKVKGDEEMISTDRDKFNSIVTNLLKNAIKYTEKGTVEFGAKIIHQNNQKALQCYVKDTGIGIPEDMLDKVFNRFTRDESHKKSLFEGSGLGLSITKSYIDMLKGDITVKSAPNEGSDFRFTLPLSSS